MHHPRKRFGQHFLVDQNIIQHLVAVIAPQPTDNMVEIGPGQGALTIPILKKLPALNVVELDRDLIPILKTHCEKVGKLNIYEADALKFDFSILFEHQPLRVIGNLPYNISTPLIFHLLDYAANIQDMHFMLQKEVVNRLGAQVGTHDYGRLSIMVQYFCHVDILFDVPPGAFSPPPKVDSKIVKLIPFQTPPHVANNFKKFANLVATAFNQRRKTLRNALKSVIDDTQWAVLNIDSQLRPEQLTVKDFVDISNTLP